jgi:drug/metabolite transporter (DMT)-like permease
MPDRAIIPFTVAVMGGFFCGLLCSVLQLQDGPVATVAVAGATAAALAGAVSVLGCEGRDRSRLEVGILRTFYAVVLFLAIDYALVSFLRDASPLAAAVLLLLAALAAGMLATPRVQPQRDAAPDARRHDGAQPTT